MIKLHDARSLGKYLGKKMAWEESEAHFIPVGILTEVHSDNGITVDHAKVAANKIYPILYSIKTLAKRPEDIKTLYGYTEKDVWNPDAWPLSPDDIHEDSIHVGDCKYGIGYDFQEGSPLYFWQVSKLFDLGYGAIQDLESPTGYVDFWNHACVCGDDL